MQKYYSESILKSIKLFFLLVIALSVSLIAGATKGVRHAYRATADTIIKRDTIIQPKRTDGRKAPDNKGVTKPIVKTDTSKNKGGLQSQVKAVAEDSTIADHVHDILYLYGKARVTYEDFELDADYIRVDQKKHLIFASGRMDPKTHRYTGRPITKQKNDSPIEADSIYFNYETKKAKSFNAASGQEGNFLSGGTAKRLNDNEIAYRNVLYSTCDLPYPETHFGIVITKGIAEKNQIISGPAYLEIANIPLPIAIPFGFFPKPDHRTSGVILPTFGEDARLGFYLRDFGYYIALNDNIDLTNNATIYSKGSYEASTTARYLKRYAYQGTFSFRYGSHNYGNVGDPSTKDFNILWSHSQDPNSNPGTTFSASVNAGTHSFYQNSTATTNYSLQQITQNNLQSSISYSRVWAGTPFNLNVSLEHQQDLYNKTVTMQLPNFSFNMSTISPFDSKERVGEQKWYQRITVGYSLQGTNTLNAIPEADLFKSAVFKDFRTGFEHTIPVGLNLTVLKYFQFSTSANYVERWYFQTIREAYSRTNPLGSTTPVIDTVNGFSRAGEYSLSANLSTKLFGQLNFKKGKLSAIRHVMTPTFSFNYHPDYSNPSYGYYRTVVSEAGVPYPYTSTTYSIFNQSPYGGPSAGRQAGIGFNLDNTIEGKVRAKSTDTSGTDKKIQILQGLSFSTFYNFAVDSFRLSPINFNGHTAVFNQRLNLSLGGTFNPYVTKVMDSVSNSQVIKYSRTIDRYTWQDGRLPRLQSFFASADINFNSKSKARTGGLGVGQIQPNLVNPQLTPEQAERLSLVNQDPSAFVDFNVPWNINLNYSFNYSNSDGIHTSVSNTVQARGDVNITPKWKVTYYTDYDLRTNKVSTCQLGIYRDLHCWDLSVQWIPFGYYKMYSVTLRVKNSILQDLKLSKRSDYTSNQYYNPYY